MAINGLEVLAIIPARGGSKGLPRKNILPLAGKPLIAWTIEQAKESKYIDKVFVSTDDEEIAQVARDYGVDVPFLRPKELAGDGSTVTEAVLDAIDRFEKRGHQFKIVVSLEPTKCLRETSDIDKCIEKLTLNHVAKSIVSLVPIKSTSHPDWAAKINSEGFIEGKKGDLFRRQNLSERYGYSGTILASKINFLKEEKTFFTNKTLGFILDEKEKTLDIDNETDFIFVEAVLKKFLEKRHFQSKKRISLGMMQGRLSPRNRGRYQSFPKDNWEEEFSLAKKLGFDSIEFIFDYEDIEENPLSSSEGIKKIRKIINQTGVKVFSICADYFMRFWLHEENNYQREKNIRVLKGLIKSGSLIGVKDITIPFVDESSLKNENSIILLEKSLLECLPYAKEHNINLNLETDLPPKKFLEIIEKINHSNLKINYDIGNSASLGYDPVEEWESYGKYISVLHVKDRIHRGGSVKLGTGDANFEKVFEKIKNEKNFKGPIILQAARAENYENEMRMVEEQFNFLKKILNQKNILKTSSSNKIAFVSGSSRGIGKGIAEELANQSYIVFINGRNEKTLNETLKEIKIKDPGAEVYTICSDLEDTNNIKESLNFIKEKVGKFPDIVVANIGTGKSISGWEINDEEWSRMMGINFLSAAKLCRESINVMKNQGGGNIVCISSIAGHESIGAPIPYSASKSALLSMVKSLSKEIAKYNIRINSISPGNVLSREGIWERKLKEDEFKTKEYIKKSVPLNDFASPQDIANMVSFLISDKGKFITGSDIIIDGGQTNKFK